ncbi:acetylornithine and succinylornithine aminotransferase, partial [mine drainage metagenome]
MSGPVPGVPPPEPPSRAFVAPSRALRTIVRGEGAALWDAAGRRFVDLGATHGVGNLGASHPEVVAAIRRQAGELLYLGTGYDVPIRSAFMERLTGLLPPTLDRV